MQQIFGALTLLLLIALVLSRAMLMRRHGIRAIRFGKIDKKDFLIPPIAAFYFYIVFAAAFGFPTVTRQTYFHLGTFSWAGVFLCLAGLALFLWSLVSFGKSFRVGIDLDRPDRLVTTGVFAFSRNPIYVVFGLVLLGEFLIFSNPILLIYLPAAGWLIHRQVLREEEFLSKHYGQEYTRYRERVRRYI